MAAGAFRVGWVGGGVCVSWGGDLGPRWEGVGGWVCEVVYGVL